MSWSTMIKAGANSTNGIVNAYFKSKALNKLADQEQKALDAQKNYVPPALLQAEANTQQQVNASRYAGEDQDEQNIQQSASNAYNNLARSTTSSTNLANAALGIQGQENQAYQNVGQKLAQYKQNANQNWTNVLMQKANQQQQQKLYNDQIQGAIWQNRTAAKNAMQSGIIGFLMPTVDGNNTGSIPSASGNGGGSSYNGMSPQEYQTYGQNPDQGIGMSGTDSLSGSDAIDSAGATGFF